MISIKNIEVFWYSIPVEKPVVASFGIIPDRIAVIARVTDEEDDYGWGELWSNFPSFASKYKATILARLVAPQIIGKSFANCYEAWKYMTKTIHVFQLQSGETGSFSAAIACVDNALWDLLARKNKQPLYRYLGGTNNKVRVYASGLNPGDGPEVVAERKAQGFTAFKQKIGFGAKIDERNLAAIRDIIDDNDLLMVDATQKWDFDTTCKHLSWLNKYNLYWLEEPMPVDTADEQWQQLKKVCQIPLAGGENMNEITYFKKAIDQWLDFVQPDLGKWGGISRCFDVAKYAEQQGKTYCPHWLAGGIGLLCSAHVLAAVNGKGLLEFDVNENPLQTLLAQPFPQLEAGILTLSDEPGIAIEPDLSSATLIT